MHTYQIYRDHLDTLGARVLRLQPGPQSRETALELLAELGVEGQNWAMAYTQLRKLTLPELQELVEIKDVLTAQLHRLAGPDEAASKPSS